MPNYTFKAHDIRNRVIAGTIEGASIDEVVEKLSGKNLLPVTIEELNFDGTTKNQTFS